MEFVVARGACDGFGVIMDFHGFLHFFPVVNPQTMNDTISFRHGTELAVIKGTLELFTILRFGFELLWVLGTHVKVQRLLL